MLVIVWEYRVNPDRIDEFESFYRPDGPWAGLFRKAPGFVSITLMKDLRDSLRYIVADRWTSETLYEEFKASHRQAYDDLTERGLRLIQQETEIGRFDFME